jgi:spoIIIJ-associated protein
MDKLTSLEVIAPSVEEAVVKGLGELGLPEDAVEVEVLDSGSRGLFGLGFRQARVRLTIKSAPVEPAPEAEFPVETAAGPGERAGAVVDRSPLGVSEPLPAQAGSASVAALTVGPTESTLPAVEATEEEEMLLRVARETVEELLMRMRVPARVTASMAQPEDANDRSPLLVDVRGEDLSVLIGPRAETLNALQYIAGLIIGKEVGRAVPLVVDVEGYRARHNQQIRQLARRMAEQAVKTGKRQILEPMPASERRLVHIELRDHPDVRTESIGEEPKRKVTIIPK